MDLHEALTRAVVFTWGGKQQSPLRYVRLLPPTGGLEEHQNRAHVYANNGQQGVMLRLDVDAIPNIALDGDTLKAGLKGAREVLDITSDGSVTTDVGTFQAPLGDINAYPQIPTPPEGMAWYQTDTWWGVEQVFHAVSKDKQQRHLGCVHFKEGVVEATDRHRVARSFLDLPQRGLVPFDVFKNWPKGELVQFAFSPDTAWFTVGDETRMTVLHASHNYPDLDEVLPGEFTGFRRAVPTKPLQEACKQSHGFSKGVLLTFGEGVTLSAGSSRTEIEGAAPVGESNPEPISVAVEGKWLAAALKQVTTPNVLLGYTSSLDPLRIESGVYLEALWPIMGA